MQSTWGLLSRLEKRWLQESKGWIQFDTGLSEDFNEQNVLQQCEASSFLLYNLHGLVLSDQAKFTVFDNKIWRTIFWHLRDENCKVWRHNDELIELYSTHKTARTLEAYSKMNNTSYRKGNEKTPLKRVLSGIHLHRQDIGRSTSNILHLVPYIEVIYYA